MTTTSQRQHRSRRLLPLSLCLFMGCGSPVATPDVRPEPQASTPVVPKAQPLATPQEPLRNAMPVATTTMDAGQATMDDGQAARAAELVRRLQPALSHSVEGLEASPQHGHRVVDLQGRFHHALVAHVDEAGKVQQLCVDTPAQAQAFLSGTDGHKP